MKKRHHRIPVSKLLFAGLLILFSLLLSSCTTEDEQKVLLSIQTAPITTQTTEFSLTVANHTKYQIDYEQSDLILEQKNGDVFEKADVLHFSFEQAYTLPPQGSSRELFRLASALKPGTYRFCLTWYNDADTSNHRCVSPEFTVAE